MNKINTCNDSLVYSRHWCSTGLVKSSNLRIMLLTVFLTISVFNVNEKKFT